MDSRVTSLNMELNVARKELAHLKKELFQQKLKDEKMIADLNRENKHLLARLKQIQSSAITKHVEKQETNNSFHDDDDNIFHVQAILDDKMEKGTRLVHWKGYDLSDATWEREQNLNCDRLLLQYKRTKRTKETINTKKN